MLRVSKLSDYAIVLLTEMAQSSNYRANARLLAAGTNIAKPTVVKLLKQLKEQGLLSSEQGRHGGYRLARAPSEISLSDIIEAVEGPIALTECIEQDGDCQIRPHCAPRSHWVYINAAFRQALLTVTLDQLLAPRANRSAHPLGGPSPETPLLPPSP